mgnify:CR=1 FL=1
MIDLEGLGYLMWYLFSTVLLVTSIVYFIIRKRLQKPRVLWWINIVLVVINTIIIGLLTNWGYWRGSSGQATGTLGEPGEVFGAMVVLAMFLFPTFLYLLDLMLLLIFRPKKESSQLP